MPMRFLGIFIAVFAAITDAAAGEWSFDYREGLIWVDVRVNGSAPLKFIVDSAATHHVISSSAARRLGLATSDETLIVRRTDSVEEQAVTEPVKLSAGDWTAENSSLLILPLEGINGIIGLSLLEEHVVQIDYAASTIRLLDRAPAAVKGTCVVPLRVRDHLMGIRLADSTGKPGWFVLDTGCSSAILMSSQASERFGFCRGCGAEAHVLYASGKIETQRFRRTRWRIGDFVIADVEAVVSAGRSRGLLADRGWAGIVGNGLLSRFKVTLDFSRQKLLLER
jgi:predicted aspartyl protease